MSLRPKLLDADGNPRIVSNENISEANPIPWVHAKPKRDEFGRWLPGEGGNTASTSAGQLVASWFRNKLGEIDPKEESGKTKMELMFNNMLRIATTDDDKYRKEAVWAFNALMDRAFGPPIKDKSELDAIAQGGLKIQIVEIGSLPASNRPVIRDPLLPPQTFPVQYLDSED